MPMTPARALVYAGFVALLVTTFALSHSVRSAAADYAALPASASDVTPKATGDAAPAFTVRTVDDEPYRFDPHALERPAILISFRGGWCPYCNLHLSELRNVIPQLSDMGYDVLFLSGDRPEQLYEGLEADTQQDIAGRNYVILSDADMQAARALGIAFRIDAGLHDYLERKDRDYEGSSIGKHNALAVPAVYVIDVDGRIVFDFVNANYKIRLPADELLTAARRVAP